MPAVPRAGFCTDHLKMASAQPARLQRDSIQRSYVWRSLLNADPLGSHSSMVTVRHAQAADLPAVTAFYRAAGYGAAVSLTDDLLLAELDQRLVGVVRLAHEHGVTVLRGMRVDPAFQRQGIGTQLLLACQAVLGPTACFCIPYAHLVQFYGTIGFQEVALSAAPPFLAARLTTYRAERPEAFTVMSRPGHPEGVAAPRAS